MSIESVVCPLKTNIVNNANKMVANIFSFYINYSYKLVKKKFNSKKKKIGVNSLIYLVNKKRVITA